MVPLEGRGTGRSGNVRRRPVDSGPGRGDHRLPTGQTSVIPVYSVIDHLPFLTKEGTEKTLVPLKGSSEGHRVGV